MKDIKTNNRKEIIKAILQIALEVAKIIGTAIGATLFLIFESFTRFSLFSIIINDGYSNDEFVSFEIYKCIGDFVENIKDQIEEIKDASYEIKMAKEEIKLALEEKKKALLTTKDFKDSIIEYIKNILLRIEQLPEEEQRLFTERLKEILLDYTSKYFDALKNPSNEPLAQDTALLVRQTTLDKLVTIDLAVSSRIKTYDKISAISLEEEEVLSMMQSTTETSSQNLKMKL